MPYLEDLENGVFRFVISSGFDFYSRKATIQVNGYFKLGDFLISSLQQTSIEKETNKTTIEFNFEQTTSNSGSDICVKGKGKAVMLKDSLAHITVSFMMGDTNCTLENLYICSSLYHTPDEVTGLDD